MALGAAAACGLLAYGAGGRISALEVLCALGALGLWLGLAALSARWDRYQRWVDERLRRR
jgi:hypothetical protein